MKFNDCCQLLDLSSKYTLLKHFIGDSEVLLRVQTWICPECGNHGSRTEIVKPGTKA